MMNKMNAEQLIEKLEGSGLKWRFWNYCEDFGFDEEPEYFPPKYNWKDHDDDKRSIWFDKFDIAEKKFWNDLGVGEFQQVDRFGGEGSGDTAWSVVYFKDHDIHLRWDFWYASYHGFDGFEAPKEVKPQEKTVTVYE